ELEPKAILLVESITNFNFGKIISLFINLIDRLFNICSTFVENDWIIRVFALFSFNFLDYFDNTQQTIYHYTDLRTYNSVVEEVTKNDSYSTCPQQLFFHTFKTRLQENEENLDELLAIAFDSFKHSKWNTFNTSVINFINIYRILVAQIFYDKLELFKIKIEGFFCLCKKS
ncbi:MAG: hypothetical protein OMM_13035, partial [Candidatus Magnetoglobus multicellularis str. Araruama]